MFGFVCLHVIGYSSIAPLGTVESQNRFLMHFRWVLNAGVDVFAFISGFYGIRFSIRKALNLLYIGAFSSLCVLSAEIFFFDVDFKIISLVQIFLKNWYFREYLILFLLAPFLNKFFKSDDSARMKSIVFPLAVLFAWNFLAAQFSSSFGQSASLGDHTAMLLVMMYLLGRFLSTTGILQKVNIWILVLSLLVCLPILFCFVRLKDFSSPFCIIAAICLFEIFRRLPVPATFSKAVCFLSPSMLGILILHNAGSHQISGGLVHRYFENFTGDLKGLAFLKYATVIFSGALVIDLARRLLGFLTVRLIQGCIKK